MSQKQLLGPKAGGGVSKSLGQGSAERQSGEKRAEDIRDSSCLHLSKSYLLHVSSARVLTR